jgi:hypothetical protein
MVYVSTWLQAALIPPKWRVAGVSCGALSVWHTMILGSFGNPYIVGDVTRMDMNAANDLLTYASQNHAGGVRLFTDPAFRARVMKTVGGTLGSQDWPTVHDACMHYVETCRRVPAHKQAEPDPKAGKPRMAAAPFAWTLVSYLSGGDPARVEAAWDAPFALACCLFDAHRDVNGMDSSLETLEEAERFDGYLERQKAGAS